RRFHRFMSAGLATDRPWHSRIAWFASDRVIPTLATSRADRMNRWKIKDVEAHCLCVVHARQAIPEGRSAIPVALRRARKKFIPRAEQRYRPIDHDMGNRLILRGIRAIRVGGHKYFQLT